jgi:hypothetical protein
MTVTTAANTPTGSYSITVISTGPPHHGLVVTLVVNAPATGGDYSISASPASQSVVQGSSTTYTLTITPSNGFTGTVTFSTSGLPSGATASFSPPSLAGSGSSTMTVTTAANTPTGNYPVAVSGSGPPNHSTSMTLVVNAAADFSLSATPASQTVAVGASTSYAANITRTGGFTGNVTFSASGLPAGTTGTFSPNPATGNTSTLNITTSPTTPTGSYQVTITGTSGALTHSTSVTLVVNQAPTGDFSLSVTPGSRRVSAGASASFTVSISRTGGFTGGVNLTVGGLPPLATASFSPNPSTGNSSTLTVVTSPGTGSVSSVISITGTSGSLTHTTTVKLKVVR